MRPLVLAALLALPSVAHADFAASPAALCRTAIAAAERSAGIPERLMQSIGIIESGRRDETGKISPWPWAINAEGVGAYFATKAEAIAPVTSLRARGVRSIDVGCMQVNLMHHSDAFASLDEAFDPAINARYAGRFLNGLLARTGSWPAATAGYHSLTPGIGDDYARKVLAVWAKPAPSYPPTPDGAIQMAGLQPWTPSAIPPASAIPLSSTVMSLPGGGRIIPIAASVAAPPGAMVGRGLAAYRAAPTMLAARVITGRPSLNPPQRAG